MTCPPGCLLCLLKEIALISHFMMSYTVRYASFCLFPPHCDGCGAPSSSDYKMAGLTVQGHNEIRDAMVIWCGDMPVTTDNIDCADDETLIADLGVCDVW